jgi:hypothetical protein
MYCAQGGCSGLHLSAMAYGRSGVPRTRLELDARTRLGTGRHDGRNLSDGPADCAVAASQVSAVLWPDGPMTAQQTRTGRWQGRGQNDAMFEICSKVLRDTQVLKDVELDSMVPECKDEPPRFGSSTSLRRRHQGPGGAQQPRRYTADTPVPKIGQTFAELRAASRTVAITSSTRSTRCSREAIHAGRDRGISHPLARTSRARH